MNPGMIGMSSTTGKAIEGAAHLAQSIFKILSTPLGSRVMRRPFGSLFFDLVDQPTNAATAMLLRAAGAVALSQWEPRLTLTSVTLSGSPANGNFAIGLTGKRADSASNAATTLTIPLPSTLGGSD